MGPVRGDWPNSGKLSSNRHHCHIKKGRPTYVMVWRVIGAETVEVIYVGTHERAESIGQALYYSIQTGKRAGVVLILEKPGDYKYWIRLNTVIDHFRLAIDTRKMGQAGH